MISFKQSTKPGQLHYTVANTAAGLASLTATVESLYLANKAGLTLGHFRVHPRLLQPATEALEPRLPEPK